jgi:SAM-dependent methyltransferase
MEFAPFDTRHYPTLPVQDGYREWAESYEATVLDLMDIRLLERLRQVDWHGVGRAVDLACGTGRTGRWLRQAGVAHLDGVDFTEAMLQRARATNAYDRLVLRDMTDTGLERGRYDLVTEVLGDEHLPEPGPLYREAARLAAARGRFVIVGYHPHFLMMGIATHFDRASGQSVAIESHVHLMSSHVAAAHACGFRLIEMVEGVVDDAWIAAKPKWAVYRNHPVSFAITWRREQPG